MNSQISNLARQAADALNRQAIPELESLSKQILQLDESHADAWFFLSLAATERGRIKVAIELINRAIGLNTSEADYVAHKSRLHAMAGDREAAIAAADYSLSLKPETAVAIDTLGVVYSRFELHEKARDVLKQGVLVAPDNAQFHFNLASVEQFLGNMPAAEAAYRRALELKPDFFRAWWALSELEKNTAEPSHLDSLVSVKDRASTAEDKLYLGHALSREYEKAGDYDAALAALRRGKEAMKQKIGYDLRADQALFQALIDAFPAGDDYPAGESGDQNIFVLGMPRSGTTLVDRILDSHSKITSLGELPTFGRAVKAVSGSPSRLMLDAPLVRNTARLDYPEIGRRYLYETGQQVPLDRWSVDKMPLNFLYVGYILRALPGAKIVSLRRHPVDTCLSNYRQLFAVNFSYYNYHYDLQHTAEYYALFDRLMRHWCDVFGERILEVHYEQLVADPEPVVRRLCDFVDCGFEPACLSFHENPGAVSTASTVQVRQPLYDSAVDRWKKYGDNLSPVFRILEAHNIPYQ